MILNIIIGLVISLFHLPKKRKMFTSADVKTAIEKVKLIYGADAAAIVEKILRLESAHFTSEQFRLTGSGGMEAFAKSYPFGWSTMKEFTDQNPQFKPVGTVVITENNTGKKKTFIKFPSVMAAMLVMAYILNKRGWNGGSWFSTNATAQAKYNKSLAGIKTIYT